MLASKTLFCFKINGLTPERIAATAVGKQILSPKFGADDKWQLQVYLGGISRASAGSICFSSSCSDAERQIVCDG